MSVRRKLLLLRPSRDEHTVIRKDILYYGDSVANNIDSIILSPKDYEEIFNHTRSKSPIMKNKYSIPGIEVLYLSTSDIICAGSPQGGGIEGVDYENWTIN